MIRTLMPLLTIVLSVVSGVALLLAAATTATPPLPVALPTPAPAPPAIEPPISAASATVLVRGDHVALPPPPLVVGLARLTYRPGAESPRRAQPGPFLLVVEAGSLTVNVAGPAWLCRAGRTTATVDGGVSLGAGDGLVLAAGATAAFRNDGATPVLALAAAMFPTTAATAPVRPGRGENARWTDDWSPGAIAQPLAGGWVVDPPATPAALALRRVSISPGDDSSLATTGAAALAVETGALTMAAGQGLIWLQYADGSDDSISPGARAVLLPGDGALFQAGASATLRNDGSGPLLALVLTVTPSGSPATPPGIDP